MEEVKVETLKLQKVAMTSESEGPARGEVSSKGHSRQTPLPKQSATEDVRDEYNRQILRSLERVAQKTAEERRNQQDDTQSQKSRASSTYNMKREISQTAADAYALLP